MFIRGIAGLPVNRPQGPLPGHAALQLILNLRTFALFHWIGAAGAK